MITMDGYRIDDGKENIIEIIGSSITKKDSLRKYLNTINVITNSLLGNTIKLPSTDEFKITINRYGDIVLVIVEDDELKSKCYYLFDEELRYLSVANKNKTVEFKSSDKVITNDLLNDSKNTSTLVHFINYLDNLKKTISFNFESAILCSDLRIFNGENAKIIIENEELIFAQHNFHKDNIHKIHYIVILKDGLRRIGSIDCYLNEENISNFGYSGNFLLNLDNEYLNMGYERKILSLLKQYLNGIEEKVNKTLFIAVMEDDNALENAVVINGGVVSYNGDVPSSDPLNYMGKVKKIRVYRIG